MSASACTRSMPGCYYYSFFCLPIHHQLDWFRRSGYRWITSDSLFMASDTILCFFVAGLSWSFQLALTEQRTQQRTVTISAVQQSSTVKVKVNVKVPYSDINVGGVFVSLCEAIKPVGWHMSSATSDLRLPSQPKNIATAPWPVLTSHPDEGRRLSWSESSLRASRATSKHTSNCIISSRGRQSREKILAGVQLLQEKAISNPVGKSLQTVTEQNKHHTTTTSTRTM